MVNQVESIKDISIRKLNKKRNRKHANNGTMLDILSEKMESMDFNKASVIKLRKPSASLGSYVQSYVAANKKTARFRFHRMDKAGKVWAIVKRKAA